MNHTILICLLLIIFIINTFSLQLKSSSFSHQCIHFEADEEELVMGSFVLFIKTDTYAKVSVHIKDPNGNRIHDTPPTEGKGQFSFIAEIDGSHEACFENLSNQDGFIQFEIKSKTQTADITTLIQGDHLSTIKDTLNNINQLIDHIDMEFEYLEAREIKMKKINQATYSRLIWFSFITIMALVAITYYQISFLKNFFRKRKLIAQD